MRVFVDTSFFFALASPAITTTNESVRVLETFARKRLSHPCLTTDYVVFETITLSRKLDGNKAVRIGTRLYREVLARIHWVTKDVEEKAFDYVEMRREIGELDFAAEPGWSRPT